MSRKNAKKSAGRDLFASHYLSAVFASLLGLFVYWRCPEGLSCLAALAVPLISLGAAALGVRSHRIRMGVADASAEPELAPGRSGVTFAAVDAQDGGEWEMALRVAALERENRRLLDELEGKNRLHARLIEAAGTDPLTGLPNRRTATLRMDHLASRFARSGEPFSVVMCDLDRFKDVNDVWGHDIGDQALRHAAGLLRASLRAQDMAARWGGEEFLFVLADTGVRGACECAEKTRAALEAGSRLVNGRALGLRGSFGVAAYDGSSLDDVIRKADKAMYAAKNRGGNQIARDDGRGVPAAGIRPEDARG